MTAAMEFGLGCRLGYRFRRDTPVVFNVEAQRFGQQTILSETLTVTPRLDMDRWTMPDTGNRYFRVHAPPGELTVEYQARVALDPVMQDSGAVTEVPVGRLPLSVLPQLYPSRYCQSDRLERFARSTFGALAPGYTRVNGVCNWINDYVAYEGGVSDALTSAFDTVTQRAGVCRDFAHLGIALCRAMGIPARYVSAYASHLNPPDFHAVFEAFLHGDGGPGWFVFDPTRKSNPAGLVRIGIGRDAADAAFATPFGNVEYEPPNVWINPPATLPPADTRAVRLGGVAA